MISILPITTWDTPCGIAEYARHLRDSLEDLQRTYTGPQVFFQTPNPAHLDPQVYFIQLPSLPDHQVVWLNYHAALHSQWTPQQVDRLHRLGKKVVITYHDTGVPNSEQCKQLWITQTVAIGGAAQPFIIHEPCEDLPGAIYLRQGVPPRAGAYEIESSRKPIVGTVGFPFPWKNYDLLCEASALAGWSTLLLAPGATDEQVERWLRLNPKTEIVREFIAPTLVVSYLSGCDATAFLYMCANTGTSGAIRQGLAARKPVLATKGCRQFRDLELAWDLGGIHWLDNLSPAGVADALACTPITSLDAGIHRIAERDSWYHLAERYAEIFTAVMQDSK